MIKPGPAPAITLGSLYAVKTSSILPDPFAQSGAGGGCTLTLRQSNEPRHLTGVANLKNKIALEEPFAIDLTIDQSKIYSQPVVWERLKSNLLDFDQQRLERMDEGGTAFSILSLNSPGIQCIPNVKKAIDVPPPATDTLTHHIPPHPTH